jgi:hypothetical protein
MQNTITIATWIKNFDPISPRDQTPLDLLKTQELPQRFSTLTESPRSIIKTKKPRINELSQTSFMPLAESSTRKNLPSLIFSPDTQSNTSMLTSPKQQPVKQKAMRQTINLARLPPHLK